MDHKELAATLHPLERKVLPLVEQYPSLHDLTLHSKLQEIEVMRALQWLSNKKAVELTQESYEIVKLDKHGIVYKEKGLPERNFLNHCTVEFQAVDTVMKKSGIDAQELSITLGTLRKKAAIELSKEDTLVVKLTKAGQALLEKPSLDEKFLKSLSAPRRTLDLKPEEVFSLQQLKTRPFIIKEDIIKKRTAIITALGKDLLRHLSTTEVVDRLTPQILRDGSWKNKDFRAYDVEINVPVVQGAKRHFVNQATETAKQIWISMGFEEMTGPLCQTSFWNFDALYSSQDHPVREMQDTFFTSTTGTLPDKKLVKEVKRAHETGIDGSTGWQYSWREETAKTVVLRTHTTALSSKTVSQLKEFPVKYFALGKCFRNETMDSGHLFEFNQTEGIVIDPNANFCHLLGYLKQFFAQMGFSEARFRPAYFPYTEPSVEIDVYHPVHKKWIELGGAGMFRPEVVIPLLGKDIPVLAWGPGFDRIILDYYKILDIRDLYKNDIAQLKTMKTWMN